MSVKILSRRSNYLERAIIFEVDGEIKDISAPRDSKSFDDLVKLIENEYGDVEKPTPTAPKGATVEPSNAVNPTVEEKPAEADTEPAATETPAVTTAKKTSSRKKSKS